MLLRRSILPLAMLLGLGCAEPTSSFDQHTSSLLVEQSFDDAANIGDAAQDAPPQMGGPVACEADSECPVHQVCFGGRCRAGCNTNGECVDCDDDEQCNGPNFDRHDVVRGCPSGFFCSPSTATQQTCLPLPTEGTPCRHFGDCPRDQVCQHDTGVCSATPTLMRVAFNESTRFNLILCPAGSYREGMHCVVGCASDADCHNAIASCGRSTWQWCNPRTRRCELDAQPPCTLTATVGEDATCTWVDSCRPNVNVSEVPRVCLPSTGIVVGGGVPLPSGGAACGDAVPGTILSGSCQ